MIGGSKCPSGDFEIADGDANAKELRRGEGGMMGIFSSEGIGWATDARRGAGEIDDPAETEVMLP